MTFQREPTLWGSRSKLLPDRDDGDGERPPSPRLRRGATFLLSTYVYDTLSRRTSLVYGNGAARGASRWGAILMHPFVIGEIALGPLNPRPAILHMLSQLPALGAVTDTEALAYIERRKLIARGIGYVGLAMP